jgi:hypothetical protein
MDLFDFNHDGEVSNLERIMGLAAVLSEANPDVEISVTVDEDEDYESMTHDEFAPSETLWSARNQMILIVRHTKSGKNNANNSTRKLRKLKTY